MKAVGAGGSDGGREVCVEDHGQVANEGTGGEGGVENGSGSVEEG